MINVIKAGSSPEFLGLVESDPIDEVEDYSHKGQYYGHKIFRIKDGPLEGYWKVKMVRGDMCGDHGYEDAVRVFPAERTIVENYWSTAPVRTPKTYTVTAYRWGDKELPSILVGTLEFGHSALAAAKHYEDWRGGKYTCEVVCSDGTILKPLEK